MYHSEICPKSGQQLIISNELSITSIYCEYLTVDKQYSYFYSNGYLFDKKENKKYHLCDGKWKEFIVAMDNKFFYSQEAYKKYISEKFGMDKSLTIKISDIIYDKPIEQKVLIDNEDKIIETVLEDQNVKLTSYKISVKKISFWNKIKNLFYK